ncbi:uncharacterized protein wu:fc21g02 [Thalassophryne amazonica]|uniref:uncharacterized protein wu:fc21g02 n=1 Tax=Thalassophryne amazonica TaxID=390379 RepID=UPI001471A369|nr:uncharacterized protein wu:fc21g02 [Thalassophryne amazonica]
MMWTVVMVLTTAVSAESGLITQHIHHRLTHGSRLKIFLGDNARKLEFTPVDDPSKVFLYWDSRFRAYRGRVVDVSRGSGVSRLRENLRWYLDEVTYDDEGVYTERDFWDKAISVVKVDVTASHNHVKCVAGESLTISLAGIKLEDAFLFFSGKAANATLVQAGAGVSQTLPGYLGRVVTFSKNIEIKHVNITDEGQYTLRDSRGRVVSVTRMDLTDHHDYSSALTGLLVLLGIPAGLCCCFRKKIFRQKATTASTQAHTVMLHPPASGPQGPCPPYNTPRPQYYPGPNPSMGPAAHAPPESTGPGHWNAPAPSPGFNPAYPPQNVAYPPAGQQWNQYPPAPAPAAPVGYTSGPVMYNTQPPPPAATEPVKSDPNMTSTASSPVASSLTAPTPAEAAPSPQAPVPPFSTEPLTSYDVAYKFQIDGEKSSTNFL